MYVPPERALTDLLGFVPGKREVVPYLAPRSKSHRAKPGEPSDPPRARAGYEEVEDVQKMLPALQTCLEMLSNASSKDGGESYTLSKSLQGMGELVFKTH